MAHLKRIPLVCLALALLTEQCWADDPVALPERSTAIFVSNRDVNRVYCPAAIDDVVWSAEKPAKVTHNGQNVNVKFLVARRGDVESYVTTPLDVHIVCGGEVYTLILHPKPIDSVTVRLGDPKRRALKSVAADWGTSPMEERVQRLTLATYHNEIPDGFTRSRIEQGDSRRNVPLFENAQLIGQYQVSAPGTGLKAVEYVLHAYEAVQLDERDFLSAKLGELVAVTVEPLNVPADGFARVIVIERSASHDNP